MCEHDCFDCEFDTVAFNEEPCKSCVENPNANGDSPSRWVCKTTETVDHPNHYTNGMECIDEMLLIFGKRVVADFCLCNTWKYRYRALSKNGKEDMDKSHWYMAKYKELVEDMEDYDEPDI